MQQWNVSTPTTEYYDHQTPGLDAVVREVIATPEIAIDTETTGLCIYKDLPLYFSLAWGQRRMTLNISALPYFAEAFADPYKRWIFANAKFDAHMLANVGMHFAGELVCTQVMHSLLYEDHPHKLKYMNYHLFGWNWADFEDTFGKIGKKQSAEARIKKAETENFDLLCEYAANDAWGTWCVYLELKKQLQAAVTHSLFREGPLGIQTLWDLFDKIEVPYTKVLWKMERRGILIDTQYLEKIRPLAEKGIETLEKDICKLAGRVINPNSSAQLRSYFFEELKLKPTKWTKGGKSGVKQMSVDESFLEHYRAEVPMAALLLHHREQMKLYSTFVKGIGNFLDDNGRIHPTYNQDVTRTGRLSAKEPNVQQIPKPENDKWNMRGAFIVADGWEMPVGDYEQLEMRLLAAASGEPGMIEVIKRGWDIHMGNASMIFGLPYDDIKQAKATEKQVKQNSLPASAITAYIRQCLTARSDAKDTGFALIYGQGARALAAKLGCSVAEAEEKIAEFEAAYPAAQAFKEEAIAETEATGYAFTILGRRRNVQEISSYNRSERFRGERIAVNTQIQGSAADVVKIAQINIDKSGIEERLSCFALMQVHDELAFECPREASAEAKEEIKEWMENPFPFDLAVPLAVDINVGSNWAAAK